MGIGKVNFSLRFYPHCVKILENTKRRGEYHGRNRTEEENVIRH